MCAVLFMDRGRSTIFILIVDVCDIYCLSLKFIFLFLVMLVARATFTIISTNSQSTPEVNMI